MDKKPLRLIHPRYDARAQTSMPDQWERRSCIAFLRPKGASWSSCRVDAAQKQFFFAPVISWTAWEPRRQAYYGIDPEPATASDIARFSVIPIILDEHQRERLMYYDKELLYESIVKHWEENCPEAISEIDIDLQRDIAVAAVDRCESYGIHRADDQHLFAGLMMRVSPSFDSHPMVRSYLFDKQIAPDDRLTRMIDELPPAIWRQISGEKRYDALFQCALPE